ncbi:MAG TPA: DinB family protein [Tepidisphaeraceae bacterium]|jgi:uncharacterized damage-inducible protein DinB
MPASDPVEILLAHDLWATRNVLEACAKLSDEQFHQRFEIGPGSLHDTIEHMLGAMRLWTDVLAQRVIRPRLELAGARRPVAELRRLLEESAAEFAEQARARPVDETVRRERGGKTYTYTRGAAIMQVATHGAHHRAHCLNMLRRLGVAPLPPVSVAEWTWTEVAPG